MVVDGVDDDADGVVAAVSVVTLVAVVMAAVVVENLPICSYHLVVHHRWVTVAVVVPTI